MGQIKAGKNREHIQPSGDLSKEGLPEGVVDRERPPKLMTELKVNLRAPIASPNRVSPRGTLIN
ncbi:hypothetical protein DIZ76_016867 [Coccidioides immitis]|nr:hypothetical protein DIZ76_016867 [Coccidioides immitis]